MEDKCYGNKTQLKAEWLEYSRRRFEIFISLELELKVNTINFFYNLGTCFFGLVIIFAGICLICYLVTTPGSQDNPAWPSPKYHDYSTDDTPEGMQSK